MCLGDDDADKTADIAILEPWGRLGQIMRIFVIRGR